MSGSYPGEVLAGPPSVGDATCAVAASGAVHWAGTGTGPEAGAVDMPARSDERRILLMDDDEMVRRVVRRMLEKLGYIVEEAREGGEAVELFRNAVAAGRSFVAVMLDLVVPGGMGGKEALRLLQEIDPSVRAIASSGYSDDASITQAEQSGFRGAIGKPYRLDELRRTLAKLVGA